MYSQSQRSCNAKKDKTKYDVCYKLGNVLENVLEYSSVCNWLLVKLNNDFNLNEHKVFFSGLLNKVMEIPNKY